jgi:hypothetical protein
MKKTISVIMLLVFILSFSGCGEPKLDYTAYAKCLTQKGITFFGSSSCVHCKKQKDELGDALQYINSVECNPQTDLEGAKKCLENKIEAYPTWKLADGTLLVGEQNFEQMGLRIGCEAPKAEAAK